jgi:hypothetical protein
MTDACRITTADRVRHRGGMPRVAVERLGQDCRSAQASHTGNVRRLQVLAFDHVTVAWVSLLPAMMSCRRRRDRVRLELRSARLATREARERQPASSYSVTTHQFQTSARWRSSLGVVLAGACLWLTRS